MAIRSQENTFGAMAFLAGVILAVLIGTLIGLSVSINSLAISGSNISALYATLVILGLIVGIFGVKGDKDLQTFLLAGAVVVIVSGFGIDSVKGTLVGIGVGEIASSVFGALSALFVPATIIVALKSVFSISKI